jgi:hypothetical protein
VTRGAARLLVSRRAGAVAEEADETELADAGSGRELVERDVARGVIAEVVAG